MKRIAYLTGRQWKGIPLPDGELPPIEAEDFALLAPEARQRGIELVISYWDDESLPRRGFEAAIVRSCWDYASRCDEFIAALEVHEREGLRVHNAPAAIKWNARKTYLKKFGAAAIETVWLDAAEPHAVAGAFDALDAVEIVIKPQIGAGGQGALRLRRNAWSEADLRGVDGAVMAQAYLRSIETEGERSLFWFGGEYSHALRKVPNQGLWLANQPGATRFFSEPPPAGAREVAEAARALAPADLLYVRIDLVLGDDGAWRVIEVEAIEPYLFLAFAPEGAAVFAEALSRVLSA